MRNINRLALPSSVATLLFVIQAPTWADDAKLLEEITVTGEAMEASNQSFTVNLVDREQLEERNISDVLRAIEEVAGMTMSSGAYSQGGVASAFQVRGFSAGGHGSDAAVYIDGISLNEGGSHGDGYADTNIIMPIELEAIRVYKGPVSALYGNFARAGTLAFETRKGGDYQEVDFFAGAYDTVNAQMAMGKQMGSVTTNFAVQAYDTTGYREHQEYTKANASGRIAYDIDSDSEIALSVRQHSGHYNSPGYITEEQFNSGEDGRLSRAPTAEDDGGNNNFSSYRIDYNTMLNDDIRLLTYGYNVDQDSVRFAKFSYTETGQTERVYSRDGVAFGASLNAETITLGKPSSWVAGIEYFDESTDAARYDSQDRVRGDVTEDRRLTTETSSLFGQIDMALSDKLASTLGVRYDHFDGDALDRLTDTTSPMEDYSHFSPKLGIRYSISPHWQIRSSFANGFALPADEAKYDASIQVEPVDYSQYEIGINGNPAEKWHVDLALFQLESSGEYQQVGGETVNFGETLRTGIEAEARYNPVGHVELVGLLGVFDSEIEKGDNVGKAVTGVPKHTATLKANYAPATGLGGTITWRSTGEYYISDDNSQSYGGFDVLDLVVFYNIDGEDGNMKLYLQANNLLDEVYAEAVWYGDDSGANYAPAAGRNVSVGLTMKW